MRFSVCLNQLLRGQCNYGKRLTGASRGRHRAAIMRIDDPTAREYLYVVIQPQDFIEIDSLEHHVLALDDRIKILVRRSDLFGIDRYAPTR